MLELVSFLRPLLEYRFALLFCNSYVCRRSLVVMVAYTLRQTIKSGLGWKICTKIIFHIELFHLGLLMKQQIAQQMRSRYRLVGTFSDTSFVSQGRHIQSGQHSLCTKRNPPVQRSPEPAALSHSPLDRRRVFICHHRRSFFLSHHYTLCFSLSHQTWLPLVFRIFEFPRACFALPHLFHRISW